MFAGLKFVPRLLAASKSEHQRVVVVDETKSLCGVLESNSTVNYDYGYCNIDIASVKKIFSDSGHVSVLYIPKSEQLIQVQLYSKSDPGDDVVSAIEYQMNNILERAKMKAENLDQAMIDKVKSRVKVKDIVNNEVANTEYNAGLGYACSFLIYIFIFLYSVQVMRGVMEEKINRIVEVIISSVRPFQLMMGKVIGVGLVGLTQFLIWVVLGFAVFSIGSAQLQSKQLNPQNALTEQTYKTGLPQQNDNTALASPLKQKDAGTAFDDSLDNMLRATNWVLIVCGFLFYFLGGYVLYSALFAAIGSAVDQDTETQQFMLPVTMPLILSIIVMGSIITNPHSSVAVWFSIIPLTSPTVAYHDGPGFPLWSSYLAGCFIYVRPCRFHFWSSMVSRQAYTVCSGLLHVW